MVLQYNKDTTQPCDATDSVIVPSVRRGGISGPADRTAGDEETVTGTETGPRTAEGLNTNKWGRSDTNIYTFHELTPQ